MTPDDNRPERVGGSRAGFDRDPNYLAAAPRRRAQSSGYFDGLGPRQPPADRAPVGEQESPRPDDWYDELDDELDEKFGTGIRRDTGAALVRDDRDDHDRDEYDRDDYDRDDYDRDGYDLDDEAESFSGSATTTVVTPPRSRLDDGEPARKQLGWHGGADLGLLVLRLALGGVFLVRGAQKVFSVLNGAGIGGFADYLAGLGFPETMVLSWAVGIGELLCGTLLVVGLFTPAAAGGVLALTATSALVNWSDGVFVPGGVEYSLVLAVAAFAVLFAGPGRVAIDRAFGWYRHPLISGFVFLALAAGLTVAVELTWHRP